MDEQTLQIVNIVRTGSDWTAEAAYWAGQKADKRCVLCDQADEETDHMWRCTALHPYREAIDKDLAKVDPDFLPAAVRHGIAPALNADPKDLFWVNERDPPTCRGTCGSFLGNQEARRLCGKDPDVSVDTDIVF